MSLHSTAVRDAKCVDRNCAHIKALDIQLSLVQEWDETGSLHTAVDDEEERPAGLEWERSVAQSVLPAPPPASCAHCSQNEFASLSFACGEFALAALYRSFRTHVYCVRSLYAQLLIRAAFTGVD